MEVLLEIMGKGFAIMLAISMPCVLTAAAIGLVVGILQAVTQVQEQTIAAAPKILAVFLVIMILGVGYIKMLTNFIMESTNIAFNVIPKSDTYALDANYYKHIKPFSDEMQDVNMQSNMNYLMKHPGKIPFIDSKEKAKYHPSWRQPNPQPTLIEKKKMLER